MALSLKLKGRYEIKSVLAEGGMAVLYKAYDKNMKRLVALKAVLDITDKAAVKLFQKECEDLASLIHPNIVEIYDVGQFEENGVARPYLVMPLLPGVTLDTLIRTSSQRLTVERSLDIICQVCRGLQAAHDKGLVHRDIKPSNIFVMEDDSVKIIDFGVAHRIETTRTVGRKGTLLYMAPEQIERKPISGATDIFSLGVVCYETLTGRRPFEHPTEESIENAILHFVPPPASELNPAVNQAISQTVHKAMAKQNYHRYSSAKEFGDTLQKALRNESIEFFNPARIRPRLQRAADAYAKGDYQFATEIVAELEAEGHLDPSITDLQRQIDQATRKKNIAQLLEIARSRMEEREYPLALQKIQEVLQLDPNNTEALALKSKIDINRTEGDINEWFRLARQHMEGFAFAHAREALQRILQLRPKEGRAKQLLSEVERLEQEYVRVRQEKERLYRAALDADQRGDISSALSKLERVLDLDRRAPELTTPGRATTYQNLYHKVRSEHEAINAAYAEARRHLENGNFAAALSICTGQLAKYPGQALFQALKIDAEERYRQALSARIAEIDRKVEAEPDLDRRVSILKQAVEDNPGETHFEQLLQRTREKRDFVEATVLRARTHEEQGQFNEALAQWEILRTIYSRYPGLGLEIERITRRREQQLRSDTQNQWVNQIDRMLEAREYSRALELVGKAREEFPSDAEFAELEKLGRRGLEQAAEAQRLLSQGQQECAEQRFEQGIVTLRRAYELDDRNPGTRALLLDTLVERARAVMDQDLAAAEQFLRQALELEPSHALARGLWRLIEDHHRQGFVDGCVSEARQLQYSGDIRGAAQVVRHGLSEYPSEPRLLQLQSSFGKELQQARAKDLEEVRRIEREAEMASDPPTLKEYSKRLETIARLYDEDEEFSSAAGNLRRRLQTIVEIPAHQEGAAPIGSAAADAVRARIRAFAQRVRRLNHTLPWKAWVTAALASVLVLSIMALVVTMLNWARRPRSMPTPAVIKEGLVEISTSPAGAAIWINDKASGSADSLLQIKLPVGAVHIEARLPGYRPAETSIDVKAGSRMPVELTLVPVLALKLLCSGNVQAVIDDGQPIDVESGEPDRLLSMGKHSLKLSTGGREKVSFSFDLQAGTPQATVETLITHEVAALLISNFGEGSRLYSSGAPVTLKVDGQPVGEVGTQGIDLPKLTPGNHTVELSDGRKNSIEIGPTRTLTAIIDSDPNTGTLIVQTNEDGVSVVVLENGKQVRRRETKKGQARFSGLRANTYTVQVSKDGYDVDTKERQAEIKKREDRTIAFQLTPRVLTASVQIRVNRGSELYVDNKSVGEVKDGVHTATELIPGKHTFGARLEGFIAKEIPVELVAGRNNDIELNLERVQARAEIRKNPPDSKVIYQRDGDPEAHEFVGTTQQLPEGDYTFTAQAIGYLDGIAKRRLESGKVQTIDLTLSRKERDPIPVKLPIEDWLKSKWVQDTAEDWYHRHAGGYVIFPAVLGEGAVEFSIYWQGGGSLAGIGKNRAQWVLDYKDEKNHILCELNDEGLFEITRIVDGKKTKLTPKKYSINPMKRYTIRVEVKPDRVIHKIQKGDGWVEVASVSGSGPAEGKFGFFIPNNQELFIRNLAIVPGH